MFGVWAKIVTKFFVVFATSNAQTTTITVASRAGAAVNVTD